MKQQKILLVAHGLWNKNVNKIQLKTGKKSLLIDVEKQPDVSLDVFPTPQ